MAKTVRVHDDTHRVLKHLKVQRRSGSIDEVIREMIRNSTGVAVEAAGRPSPSSQLTSFLKD